MKNKRANSNYFLYSSSVLISLIIIVILLGFYCIQKYSQNKQIQTNLITSSNSQIEHSDELELEVKIPAQYGYYVSMGTMHITKGDQEIVISQSGTMFPTLDEELSFLSKNNNVKIEKIEKLKDNFYKLRFKGEKTNYESIVYKYKTPSGMYTIEATSQTLYKDLDTIARNLKYIPRDNASK